MGGFRDLFLFLTTVCAIHFDNNSQGLLEANVQAHCKSYKCQAQASALVNQWFTNEQVTNARGLHCVQTNPARRVNRDAQIQCEEHYVADCSFPVFCVRNSNRKGIGADKNLPTNCQCKHPSMQILLGGGLQVAPRTVGTEITIPKPVMTQMFAMQGGPREYACWLDTAPAVALRGCNRGTAFSAEPTGKAGTILWHSHPPHTDRVISPPSSDDLDECASVTRVANLVTESDGTYLYYLDGVDVTDLYEIMDISLEYHEFFTLIGLDEGQYRPKHHPALVTREELIAFASTLGFVMKWFPKGEDVTFYIP